MDIKDLFEAKAIAINLKNTVPPTHEDIWTIHNAPAEIDKAIGYASELIGLSALADYIESIPEDRRDNDKLVDVRLKKKLRQTWIDEAASLKDKLVEISVDYQIKQRAKEVGSISHNLVSLAVKNSGTLGHTVKSDGSITVSVDGRPIKDVIQELAINEDFKVLFDSSNAPGIDYGKNGRDTSYPGLNPWRKGKGWNLTEQGKITRRDRALAERLSREAEAA
jgi:hypothetical protein